MTNEEIELQKERIADEFWHYLVYAISVDQIREHLLKHGFDAQLVDEYLDSKSQFN